MTSQLIEKIKRTNIPIYVGLGPMSPHVPERVTKKSLGTCGGTLGGAADAIWQFNKEIIDHTFDLIPAVKPQIAMYEQFGTEGLIVYKRTMDYCHEKELIVTGNAKRGDIGSTSAVYAVGHLGRVQVGSRSLSGFNVDTFTTNPCLGIDGVKPLVNVCKGEGKGLFVLVKTSNPSSREFQDRLIDGKPLYEWVAAKVGEWGFDYMDGKYSNVDAVVGATYPEVNGVLRKLMPHTYLLVLGYRAQGGTTADPKRYSNQDRFGAMINSSRGIIAAYKQEKYKNFGPKHFSEASRQAVVDMAADINSVLQKTGDTCYGKSGNSSSRHASGAASRQYIRYEDKNA